MVDPQPDLGEHLRQVLPAILAVLTPLIQAGVTRAAGAGEQGPCQQLWCPVCAIAAIASGQRHPMLDLVAEHGEALLSVLQAMATAPPVRPAEQQADAATTRYQHIPVTIVD